MVRLPRTRLVGLVLAIAALVAACRGGGDGQPSGTGNAGSRDGIVVLLPSPTPQPTPLPRKTATPTPTPSPTPLAVCGANPDPASPKLLLVEEPKPEARVKLPIHVRGWGSTIGKDERGVALAVVDAKQTVLQVLDLPPQPRIYRVVPAGIEITEYTRPFAADVVIPDITEPTPICLWIYQETTAEGVPKGVLQVPIVVLP